LACHFIWLQFSILIFNFLKKVSNEILIFNVHLDSNPSVYLLN
jgi:hypothetical protein